jgi:hypothetical protein
MPPLQPVVSTQIAESIEGDSVQRNVTALVFMLALVGLALPSIAAAQEKRGFWFSAAFGLGSAMVTCDGCASERETGGVFAVRLGGSLSERVLVGAEVGVWAKEYAIEPGVTGTVSLGHISGTIAYYPTGSGFFVRGGAGLALAEAVVNADGTNISADIGKGFGFVTGAGYDIRVSRRWSITPGVSSWYGQLGDTAMVGAPLAKDWKQNVIDFTIGITFR